MKFAKCESCGNDFIIMYAPPAEYRAPSAAKRICDRNFGIGADGLAIIDPLASGGLRLTLYNSDGTEAMFCPNAMRCVCAYLRAVKGSDSSEYEIECRIGPRKVRMVEEGERAGSIRTDIGIGELLFSDRIVNASGFSREITLVRLGGLHAVILAENIDAVNVDEMGKAFSFSEVFPEPANIVFVSVSPTVSVRIYERGIGETLSGGASCGAALIVLAKKGLIDTCPCGSEVKLRGGRAYFSVNSRYEVTMWADANVVFTGDVDISALRGKRI